MMSNGSLARCGLSLIAGLLLQSPVTRAQEAPPLPIALGFGADDEPVAMRLRDVGFLVKREAGWQMLCAAAIEVSGASNFYVDGLPSGGLVLSHFKGLQHTSADYCDLSYPDPQLEGVNVVDVARLGDTFYALVSLQDGGAIYKSEDAGATFALMAELPPDLVYFTLAASPSDNQRLYATAVSVDIDAGTSLRHLVRSKDGGQNFEVLSLELGQTTKTELLGVDPEDPDRLFLSFTQGVSSHSHGEESHLVDEFLVSEDAGDTWSSTLRPALLGGFAQDATTGEIWIGDAEGGLHHSSDRGASFELVDAELIVTCLASRGSRLWACGDSGMQDFSLGYSDDGGQSFSTVARFDRDVTGPLECGGQPLSICKAPWTSFMFWNGQGGQGGQDAGATSSTNSPDAGGSGNGGFDAGVAPGDASATEAIDRGEDSGGCDCRTLGEGNSGGGLLVGLSLSWLMVRRRRRL
ncbi:MAG: hypothetical protein OEZ06_09110 [Myxococcales bacterium]|nr:hypothetical protein [Myxococcales bacterium]